MRVRLLANGVGVVFLLVQPVVSQEDKADASAKGREVLPVANESVDTLIQAREKPAEDVGEMGDDQVANKEALLEARSYAKDYDVSLEEAQRRLGLQGRVGEAMAKVEEMTRGRFAGAWIEHEPDFHVVVRLTGKEEPPSEIKEVMLGSGVRFDLKMGAETTLRVLEDVVRGASPELQAAIPVLSGLEVDVKTGEIVLFVAKAEDGSHPMSVEAVSRAIERAQSPFIEALLKQKIRFEEIDVPASDGHTRGGANLSTCTSGFAVRHAVGVKGYITAGHCGNNQTYSEFGGVSYGTTFVDEIRDSNQDVQWHTTPHWELPHFYASSTTSYRTLQAQRSRNAQSVGGYVCHRGMTTGYSCGTIQTKNFQPTYANACPGTTCSSVWIRVSGPSLECFPGDSGGPWFLWLTAYGIYKGQSSSGTTAAGCNWAFYMASNYFGIPLLY
ncbi:MAG: S1 family peptidase [Thermoanaerobaculia bacterium]